MGALKDDTDHTISDLLEARRDLTAQLQENPYRLDVYERRCQVYETLLYPDLAAMDAYKLLLLMDEIMNDGFEYHEQTLESLQSQLRDTNTGDGTNGNREEMSIEQVQAYAQSRWGVIAYVHLARNLAATGCLQNAFEFLEKARRNMPAEFTSSQIAKQAYDEVMLLIRNHNGDDSFDGTSAKIAILPSKGWVRREIYPWNSHQVDRLSPDGIDFLNSELATVAPKLKVQVVDLPALTSSKSKTAVEKVRQLGLFAQEYINPGEEVLRERSLLTASSRLHEPLCDACSTTLPELGQEKEGLTVVSCPDCVDTVFCSRECLELAQSTYHEAICGTDIDPIAKDVPAHEAADSLYTLLLERAVAMSLTQSIHPLDLTEVKYIWGDFTDPSEKRDTLPFTFSANILTPLHLLEKLDINIFEAPHNLAETWVYNTLYAKFRGTASARLNPRDGRPEVAAVHPLWCLANHSCDPNVTWEWAGVIHFTARENRVAWKAMDAGEATEEKTARVGGIKKGDEVFSHYVDIELPVEERRAWGLGALGVSKRYLGAGDPQRDSRMALAWLSRTIGDANLGIDNLKAFQEVRRFSKRPEASAMEALHSDEGTNSTRHRPEVTASS